MEFYFLPFVSLQHAIENRTTSLGSTKEGGHTNTYTHTHRPNKYFKPDCQTLAKASSTVNIYQASISMKEFGKLDDAAHICDSAYGECRDSTLSCKECSQTLSTSPLLFARVIVSWPPSRGQSQRWNCFRGTLARQRDGCNIFSQILLTCNIVTDTDASLQAECLKLVRGCRTLPLYFLKQC